MPVSFSDHSVSGQAAWSHWHAISTSLLPAFLQASLQYFSPDATSHLHGIWAHFAFS
jgi:hypothetical protein